MKNSNSIKALTYSGLMAALAFLATAFIAVPSPFTGGYIHFGDAIVLSCGVVLGKRNGALAAGIGSALADIALGYASWALPTFIIKALLAFIVGYIFEDEGNIKKLFSLTAVYVAIWTVFNFVVRGFIGQDSVLIQSEALIADEVVATQEEILGLAASTQNILLIAALAIPLTVIVFLIITRSNDNLAVHINRAIAFIAAGSFMVILYYATYGILYGNWVVPVFSIPANLVQYGFGVVLGLALLPVTKRFSLINQTPELQANA